ncbi:hypothetical protein WJX77_002245 [Trebouxia sp. C0004]
MPVQTRQASQADMMQHEFNVNGSFHPPGLGGPRTHGWRDSANGMQLAHSHAFSNRAAQTTPANEASTQRRVCCIATPVEEHVMQDPSLMETMSAAQISQIQAAAHQLLAVCDDTKDSIQQKEVQDLKQEVHQLQALHRQEKLTSDKLLEANRTMAQERSDLMKVPIRGVLPLHLVQ